MPQAKSQRSSVLQHIGWVPFACVIAMVLVLSLAGVTWLTSPYWGHNAQAQERNVGSVPTTAGVGSDAAALALSPNRVELPTLKAQAPVVSVATSSNGELEIPLDPKIVGWWKPGAQPGAKTGTAVLAGHINYAGVTGALADIGKLKPGDPVYVFGTHNVAKNGAGRRAEVKFSVTGVRTYHKTSLPYRQIFDQKVVGRIALVTCGGPFDAATGNYLDNIVVYAVPA
ncbi:class F sortase [uncultured Jatrophihabitans sp.]|uniref:class F sortase n=1 Tax=uncultured Jatrophihabitans sp. TaxID=1610747 RepID=UPI0035C960A1